jgi:hypothetical protein
MSKYMQLTVAVRSHYPKGLEGSYRKLARHLSYLDAALAERSPSLYELAGQLDQLLYRFEGTPLREVLMRHGDRLRKLHASIEEHIADWKLAAADRLLYELEDTFDAIESELD